MSTEQRLASRAAQLRRWAKTPQEERVNHSRRMYAGLRAKFTKDAVALGLTDAGEIEQCADRLYRAHMADMARASAAKRRKAVTSA